MERYLGPLHPLAYAFVRVCTGLMLACHGLAHTFGTFNPQMKAAGLATQMGVGGLIELVCGLLVAVGLFGGFAAFLACGTMAVAYFQFHVAKGGLLPILNHGEPAVLYCFIFLLIACRGSGPYSIDGLLNRSATTVDTHRL